MSLPPYQFFGSQDSRDADVVFIVEKLPDSIAACAEANKLYCRELAEMHGFTKTVNGNLAVTEKGNLIDVFKGTADELNNALFYTYSLHSQFFPNTITSLLTRDIDLKFLRATRTVLSYFTRTSARKEVKAALQGDIDLKYETLSQLDFSKLLESEVNDTDIKKSIAFQLGQTIALENGIELFTKADVAGIFPELHPYLYRQNTSDTIRLYTYLLDFLNRLSVRKNLMKYKTEYKYKPV